MTLKEWLDSNPLAAALGIAVTTASITAGVTTYFYDRAAERASKENSIFTEQLKGRLAGIERRIGTEEQTYFDVSRLIIRSSAVASLGPNYQNLTDGAVFVEAPSDGKWVQSVTSERELMGQMAPETMLTTIPNVPMLNEKNVNLWRMGESIAVPTISGENFKFFPMIAVQVLDNEQLTRAWSSLAAAMAGNTEEAPSSDSLKELQRTLGTLGDPSEHSSDKEIKQAAALDEQLSSLFRGNIASVMLSGVLQNNLMQTQFLRNAEVDIRSVEKRGNVLYAQSALRIRSTASASDPPIPAVIASEWFIVTMPRKTVFIRTLIPSRDGRSEAFQWVTRFLAGIRIPLEGT
jgi:hypothetical protein